MFHVEHGLKQIYATNIINKFQKPNNNIMQFHYFITLFYVPRGTRKIINKYIIKYNS